MDIHQIVLEWHRHVLTDKEIDQRHVLLRQSQILLLGKLEHRALSQLVHTPFAHIALFTGVDTKEDIEHDTHHWYEVDHQCPGHRLGRLTIIKNHMDHSQDDHNLIDDKYDIQPTHHFSLLNVSSQFLRYGIV